MGALVLGFGRSLDRHGRRG